MPHIQIRRAHQLDPSQARDLAERWVQMAQERFAMPCTMLEQPDRQTVRFERSGVQGSLVITADQIDVQADLSLAMGVMAGRIQAGIERQLDELLGAAGQGPRGS